MDLHYVDSSNIEAIGYDPETSELHVKFLKTGLYVYRNVQPHVFEEFLAADSKGSYFNREIRGVYTDFEKR